MLPQLHVKRDSAMMGMLDVDWKENCAWKAFCSSSVLLNLTFYTKLTYQAFKG